MLKGSIRSPESIRTKINRLITSYKDAEDRLNGTGAGMEGIELSTFQEEVCNTTCRFYHQLRPVMVNRPNVRPWATNDDSDCFEEKEDEEESCLSSNDSDIEIQHVEPATSSNTQVQGMVIVPNSDNDSNTVASVSIVENINQDNISISSHHTSGRNTTTSVSGSTRKRSSNTISPSDAKKKHKSLLRQGKKQIGSTKSKSKIAALLEAEQQDRNFMMQSRKDKLVFETKKHDELKQIEKQKLGIEERRFRLDEKRLLAQSEIDQQKLLLVQMEVFEKREQMKKNNPHITESEINRRFNF
jgi:hypothetical protein